MKKWVKIKSTGEIAKIKKRFGNIIMLHLHKGRTGGQNHLYMDFRDVEQLTDEENQQFRRSK